jgi:hypothetical protein
MTLETPHETFDSARLDSPSWIFFVKVSFACALGGMLFGVVMMVEMPLWMRGYLVLGTLFLTGSTFTLSKTLRDQFEASKLINKLAQARTEKLLKEYGVQG